MQEVTVSTDGSCLSVNNAGNGAIGWSVVEHSGKLQRTGGAAFGTNQIAELTAVLVALRTYRPGTARAAKNLTIYSDSSYAIGASTTWLEGWKAKGWMRAGKKPISNLPIIQAIDAELTLRHENGGTVKFIWVKGHSGDIHNEQADELANSTAKSWQEKLGTKAEEDLEQLPAEARETILERAEDFGFPYTPNAQELDAGELELTDFIKSDPHNS